MPATISEIYLAGQGGGPMLPVEMAQAFTDRGLAGDRYFHKTGFYSNQAGWGAQVTFIEAEAIAAVNKGYAADFTGAMLRRNFVTANLKLESLIGQRFACGNAILIGTKPFPPCAHLAYLLGRPEVLKYFAYCGGIGASVLEGGLIQRGDLIRPVVS